MAGRIVCLTLLFIIAAAADPSTLRAMPPYGDPGELVSGWREAISQRGDIQRQREEALAAIRALVQMYPGAFGPDFLNGLTPEAAPGLLPIVQAHVLEYLRTHR
jgi:hypothetical protein